MAQRRPLNVGLIGGGAGAFIGTPHYRSIFFDGTRRVTCGALRSTPEAALEDAAGWPYPIDGYGTLEDLIRGELSKPESERMDYATIVTPNHAHFEQAMALIEAGFAVFCEKPLTLDLAQARKLSKAVKKAGIPFGVAHTYIGHWTSRLARHIARSGLLGEIRFVDAFYLQGWLASRMEMEGCKQAAWRTDPKRSGASNCCGDIGTHALMQLRYVTGLEVESLRSSMIAVDGRELDNHVTCQCLLSNGAEALVRASQLYIGKLNGLGIDVVGSKGLLEWRQEESEKLVVRLPGQPDRTYWRGAVAENDGFLRKLPKGLLEDATIPPGHAEGFHDAFARLHRGFEEDVRKWQAGRKWKADGYEYANIDDGVIGMAFVDAAVKSAKAGSAARKMANGEL